MLLRYNCAPELKLIVTALLFFCAVATLFQFLPTRFSPFTTYVTLYPTTSNVATATTSPSPQQPLDHVLENGVIKRSFYPVGTAAYNFIFMSAYRGGPNSFVVLGLSSKPLQKYGNPAYTCEYQYNVSVIIVPGNKLPLDDFGYGRMYVLVVVNCTFPSDTDPSTGGRLLFHASTNGGYDRVVNSTDTIIALNEPPNSWQPSQFSSVPKYDYLYCGSSLFGDLSPQRIREWIAYHVRLFGTKSHFVFYDAGGIHPEVMNVLQPWIELGFVTVHDVKEQERFDTFYHNQILVLNDCLHRHRFATKWMFFFDVDEYIYLSGNSSLDSIMELLNDYTMFNFEQVSMSDRLCLTEDAGQFHRINSIVARFWWLGNKNGKGVYWKNWSVLTQTKDKGGLGILDARFFNQALLAKHGWRIIQDTDSLFSKIYSAKYGINRLSFFEDSWCRRSIGSWGWNGIKWGLQMLKGGSAWSLGDGCYAKIHHPWVKGAFPIWRFQGCSNNDCVAKLRTENGDWDFDACMVWFSNETVDKISTIKAMPVGYEDLIVWKEAKNGVYSVKSGYSKLLKENQKHDKKNGFTAKQDIDWKKFWKKDGSPKQKNFLWKIFKGALSVGSERKRRGLGVQHHCCLCYKDDDPSSSKLETLEHLFRDCNFASHLWKGCRLGIDVGNQGNIPLAEWIYNWMRILSDKGRDLSESYRLFLDGLDCIWESRNNKIFRNLKPHPGAAISCMERRVNTTYKNKDQAENATLQIMDDRHSEPPGFEGQKRKDSSKNKHQGKRLELVSGIGSCCTATIRVSHTRNKDRGFTWSWTIKQNDTDLRQGVLQQARQNKEASFLDSVMHGLQEAFNLKLWHLQIESSEKNSINWLQFDHKSIQGDRMTKDKINGLLPFFHCVSVKYKV